MEDHTLSLPLLATPSSSASAAASTTADDENGFFSASSSGMIISRVLLVIFIGTISIWANHEASKGFKITIINNTANKDSAAGKRFTLFYVSNDEATRIIQNTSSFVENILYNPNYSNQTKKKQIQHVILQLSSHNLTNKVTVDTSKSREFVYIISLSPSILMEESSNVKYAVTSALQRAIARVWVWDGESMAAPWLIDGMVEYISMQAGFSEDEGSFGGYHIGKETLHNPRLKLLGLTEQICYVVSQICSKSDDLCWKNKDPKIVARALSHLEQQERGYIQGLNQILKLGWENNQPCSEIN